jgi:hypothetical protein
MREDHDIKYFEPNDESGIESFRPDVLLHWAALIENSVEFVRRYPYPKALAFAGGPIESHLLGYDLYFAESQIDYDRFRSLGARAVRAFGVNECLFRPKPLPKRWDGIICGTFALWKRHHLFAEALGSRGIAIGIHQAHEPQCYETCAKAGCAVLHEVPRQRIPDYLNASRTVVNTADFQGGGQRLTLEAMACDVPVIVMDDSPKNCEFVKEGGAGLIVPPDPAAIAAAVEALKEKRMDGREYILSKWTSQHYADALNAGFTLL